MQLYDGTSDINWFYDGLKTRAEMNGDSRYPQDGRAVLYDDGAGKVYSWQLLDVLCDTFGVTKTEDARADFDAVTTAMEEVPPDRAEQALEIAETAQQTADEAKATAQTAAEGANPQVATFVRMQLPTIAATMTDEQAISVSTLWPEWSAASVEYKVDDVVRHADHLWRCEQAHTSQESWTPDAAPSLWSQIDIAGDGVDVWTQPTGAHNAYNVGDRVHYPTASDPIYVSTIDGNVWSPDAYPDGWTLEEGE